MRIQWTTLTADHNWVCCLHWRLMMLFSHLLPHRRPDGHPGHPSMSLSYPQTQPSHWLLCLAEAAQVSCSRSAGLLFLEYSTRHFELLGHRLPWAKVPTNVWPLSRLRRQQQEEGFKSWDDCELGDGSENPTMGCSRLEDLCPLPETIMDDNVSPRIQSGIDISAKLLTLTTVYFNYLDQITKTPWLGLAA